GGIRVGMQQIGRRRAEIEPPSEFDDVIEPFLFGGGADQDLVAGEPRQPRIHVPRHAVFDGDHVRNVGDAGAQFRAHQIAAVGVAPQRDADLHLLADGLVILVKRVETTTRALPAFSKSGWASPFWKSRPERGPKTMSALSAPQVIAQGPGDARRPLEPLRPPGWALRARAVLALT